MFWLVHYFAGELTGDEIRRVNRLKIKGKRRVYNNNNGVCGGGANLMEERRGS